MILCVYNRNLGFHNYPTPRHQGQRCVEPAASFPETFQHLADRPLGDQRSASIIIKSAALLGSISTATNTSPQMITLKQMQKLVLFGFFFFEILAAVFKCLQRI